MVEQMLNQIVENLRQRAKIALPELPSSSEPLASNLEDLVGVLGASEIDPLTLEPLGDEPETRDPLEPELEDEATDPLEVMAEEESPDPLDDEPEPIAIEQKKDE